MKVKAIIVVILIICLQNSCALELSSTNNSRNNLAMKMLLNKNSGSSSLQNKFYALQPTEANTLKDGCQIVKAYYQRKRIFPQRKYKTRWPVPIPIFPVKKIKKPHLKIECNFVQGAIFLKRLRHAFPPTPNRRKKGKGLKGKGRKKGKGLKGKGKDGKGKVKVNVKNKKKSKNKLPSPMQQIIKLSRSFSARFNKKSQRRNSKVRIKKAGKKNLIAIKKVPLSADQIEKIKMRQASNEVISKAKSKCYRKLSRRLSPGFKSKFKTPLGVQIGRMLKRCLAY